MYNLYNFEPKQDFLFNYRKTERLYRLAEGLTVFLILTASFAWLWL